MEKTASKSSPGAMSVEGMATGLGWFSIGLGMAELLMPRAFGRATGMPNSTLLIRACGLREVVTGIGLLTSSDPRPWLWSRVAGDAMDMASLAAHVGPDNPLSNNARLAMLVASPIGALDLACARAADVKAKAREGAKFDYSDRVGMARPATAMRGAAADFKPPADMRQPEALRPFSVKQPVAA